jgi:hypothetical protein
MRWPPACTRPPTRSWCADARSCATGSPTVSPRRRRPAAARPRSPPARMSPRAGRP